MNCIYVDFLIIFVMFYLIFCLPQGSILGPPLFNFFIADFPADGVNQIKNISFDDDILIFKHSKYISNLILSVNNYLVAVNRYFEY